MHHLLPVRAAAIALAIPKSVTTAAPPESRMFSGLMSRWTIPSACAAASARETSRTIETTSATGSAPRCFICSRSDSPCTNGIT